jgi:signal transduction histidine kinase
VVWLVGWIGALSGYAVGSQLENIGWTMLAAAAGGSAISAAFRREERRARKPFAFLGAGLLAWALGQAAFTVYELKGGSVPYPALSDVGYLAAMPPLAAVVLTWPRRRKVWTSAVVLDGALAVAAVTVVSFSFSLRPILQSGVSGAEAWLDIFYPASALTLVAIVAGGFLLNGWSDRGRLTLVGLGLLSLAIADTASAIDAQDGSLTLFADGGWTLALAALGAASLLQRGWPAKPKARVPEFLPAIVVTCLLGVAAARYSIREFGEQGLKAFPALVLGVLLVLVAIRIFLYARLQARQNAMLAAAQKALHEAQRSRDHFLVELVNAQERGARQIADVLHDDVVQQLTALGFRLELEAQKLDVPRLRELTRDAGVITASIRGLLVELHPAILDGRGLAPAIDVVADGLRDRGIDVRVTPFPHRIERETETLAYRLVQGALANVLSDPAARSADVELGLNQGMLRGRVRSWGSGMGPEDHTSNGVSLVVARKRTELAGGRFLAQATPGDKTEIVFELPVLAATPDVEAVGS